MADTADGTWRMAPRNLAMAASISESFSPAAPTAATTSPPVSSVTVEMPSRIVAEYALSASARYPSSLVAFPIPMIKTPVAIGSRVPACPTLRVPASRRTRPTTEWDVHPAGLSITTSPAGGWSANPLFIIVGMLVRVLAPGVGRARGLFGQALVGRSGLGQQLIDLPGAFWHRVRHEGQGGSELQPELLADLGSDQASRRGQRRRSPGLILVRTQHRVEGRSLPTIPREPDVSDRHEAESRILDPALQHFGDDHLDLVSQLQYPWPGHRSPSLRAGFLPHLVRLDDVADPDVGVVGERHAALVALSNLGDVVLLPPKRGNRALRDNHAFAQQPGLGVPADRATDDHAAGDNAGLGRAEDLPDLSLPEDDFLEDRLEHALQSRLDLIDCGVDHRVVPNVDALAIGQLRGLALWPHIEANDDRIGGRRQRDIGLGDCADTAVDDPERHFIAHIDLRQSILQGLDRTGTIALEDKPQLPRLALLQLLEQLVEGLATGTRSLSGHSQPGRTPLPDLPGHPVVLDHKEAVAGP